jgi:hypothetical protein
MNKSCAFLTLAAMSLALGACGGSSEAAPDKKAEPPKSQGGKQKPHNNPWAIETEGAQGDTAKAAANPAPKKAGKQGQHSNPWAKDNPSPAPTE